MTTSMMYPNLHSYRRILHPTDLTAKDALPFRIACALAKNMHAELIVVHAAPVRDLIRVEGYQANIEHKLELLRLSDRDLEITTLLFGGEPVSEIVGWANEVSSDAIVMRRSRQSWLVGRCISNISQRVKKLVRCPVIEITGCPGNGLVYSWLFESLGRSVARGFASPKRTARTRSRCRSICSENAPRSRCTNSLGASAPSPE